LRNKRRRSSGVWKMKIVLEGKKKDVEMLIQRLAGEMGRVQAPSFSEEYVPVKKKLGRPLGSKTKRVKMSKPVKIDFTRKEHRLPVMVPMRMKKWTKQEEEVIRQLKTSDKKVKAKQIAQVLGRSMDAVSQHMVKSMGIRKFTRKSRT
jgi:hypothetical protein